MSISCNASQNCTIGSCTHKRNTRNIITALVNFLLYMSAVDDQTVVRPPDTAERLQRISSSTACGPASNSI